MAGCWPVPFNKASVCTPCCAARSLRTWPDLSGKSLWVGTWIEEYIPPGANPNIESHEVKAKRLTEKLFADAVAAGFSAFETEEERERVPPLVLAAVADSTDFDIDTYRLKSELASENEDGD